MSALHEGILAARLGAAEILLQGGIQQYFCFSPNFIGFAGHFPGEPILPAVVQIQMGVLLVESLHPFEPDSSLVLESVSRAKFMRKLLPGESILACCRKSGTGEQSYELALSVDRKAAAGARLCFAVRPNGGMHA